ncbi:thiolase family protein [Pseudomonas paeninsulae]|uniref:thiolase family protein n=1 Tax=Pseudomonas paeninsulae TaxID=3110772 RepID=UPI002D778C70|nr:thiolase family protein [Pseudomonas sp. IT1137]
MSQAQGLYSAFVDTAILDAVRTPWIDCGGALAQVSPIDLGIKVGREVLARAAIDAASVDCVLAGSMGQASFDAYMLPRHIGLYSGVPQSVPALAVQRICGTGFELLRQAGMELANGAELALCVAAESMSRNPIAAYTHRNGFRLGAAVEFKDFLWEALYDPAPGIDMIATAENLARRYGITREQVDAFALASFERALAARQQSWYVQELVAVSNERFALPGYHERAIELPRGVERVEQDSHPRATSLEALARLRPVHAGGVQTAGNSCAVVDGAAAVLVGRESTARQPVLARLLAVSAVGVAPEVMGIGPVDAIRLLLSRSGLQLADIDLFEINEAQGAQVLAVQQTLELDDARLNRCGGSIALGHPLAATGLRLCMSLAHQLRQGNLCYGVASACIGGGQGMAVLIENPQC